MIRLEALAEDFRRFGLAVVVAAVVGGLLQEVVPAGVSMLVALLGVTVWTFGLLLTPSTQEDQT